MINCLLIDDEQDALDLLMYYSEKIPSLQIVKATTNPIEALEIISERKVQLAFCDIQMPMVSGIEIAKAALGKCKLIFITGFKNYALDGYEFGIVDYLLKPVNFSRFLDAFKKAETVINLENNKTISTEEKFKQFNLSEREMEVIDWLAKNKSSKEIGEELFIATSTVSKHIYNIFKKLNVKNKYEIISMYLGKQNNL